MRRSLRIGPPPDPAPETPPDRGPLITPDEAAAHPELFNDKVKGQWVRRNVRPLVRLGHSTVLVYFNDVRDWIEARRKEGAA